MREPSMYRNTGRAEKEGAINEEKDEENAPLLAGHQDLAPNSDAARLCLDRPSWHLGAYLIDGVCCERGGNLRECEVARYTGKREALSGEACGSNLRGELRGRVGLPKRNQSW